MLKGITDKQLISQIVNERRGFNNNLHGIIEEFMNSNYEVGEVNVTGYSSPYSCVNALRNSIKRANIRGVSARVFNKKVYLIKEKQ